MKTNNNGMIICWTVFACIAIICATLIVLASNTYEIHFSMDDNMLEAVKSINYSALNITN